MQEPGIWRYVDQRFECSGEVDLCGGSTRAFNSYKTRHVAPPLHHPDTHLSTSPAYVPLIHRSAPETTIKALFLKEEGGATCGGPTHHGRLVVSVQDDDEVCDRQHSCSQNTTKTGLIRRPLEALNGRRSPTLLPTKLCFSVSHSGAARTPLATRAKKAFLTFGVQRENK